MTPSTLLKKGFNASATSREINDVESYGTVNTVAAQKLFKSFQKYDTNLYSKMKSKRPLLVNEETLLELVKKGLKSSTRRLSAKLDLSKFNIDRHLHELGLQITCCRQIPHELTAAHQKWRVQLCIQLLTNPQGRQFWQRKITEKGN